MDATPLSGHISEDSGCISGSFSTSSVFGSTPVEDFTTPSVPLLSRKRKYGQNQLHARRLQDVMESCLSTPQFSSTLNESLVNNLEKCHIINSQENDVSEYVHNDFVNSKATLVSTPATPEKKNGYLEDAKKLKGGTFYNTKLTNESPLKEAHDILYANLRSNNITSFSPLKFRESLEKLASPAKKCLFDSSEKQRNFKLFSQVTSNSVIMSKFFPYLSDGDIYRLSLVSPSLKQAILLNVEARNRFEIFTEVHRENKENYKVTPPRSPEKSDSPPGSPSMFNTYVKIGKLLRDNQSLAKCPRCSKPALVENSIGQCQNQISCGYIYCLKCFSSSSTGPEDFYDRCQSSALLKNSKRNRLSDMSNNGRYKSDESSSYICSIFHSPKSNRNSEDSSGFISENEYSPKPFHAKRNLSRKLTSVRSNAKVFHLFNDVVPTSVPRKIRTSLSAVPVIPLDNQRKQDIEPPSPPKVRNVVACSQQSKRNLKRLTR
ncbi:hypothetical protein HHI36_021603 [Cryptolaemus montrouzieri]|uniref:F-box domain-containing protein n=1 Tax=Cryptolaemus montrouzieri TaxID=559131 RepID=A0ABD2MYA5_9CUCU